MLSDLYVPKHLEPNLDTFLSLEATSRDLRLQAGYKKTYDFPGEFIDGYHQWLSRCPKHPYHMIDIGIEGWLFPADALKLYEMAYFAGDILEIGTYRGLSTTVMANAIFNSARPRHIITCDLDPVCVAESRIGFRIRNVPDRELHHFFPFEGTEFVKHLGAHERRFSFVFVDHSHNYEHVLGVCQNLPSVVESGAFVLFHDYNDPRNLTHIENYGVYQGVHDGLDKKMFDFFGVFGCTGLFRRREY